MDLFIILTYLLSLTGYSLFVVYLVRQALKLRKRGRVIACLILVGATVNGLGIVFKELKIPFSNNFIAIGFSVFLLGFVLLLYRKFKEGEVYG